MFIVRVLPSKSMTIGIFCESFVDSTRTASLVGSAVVVVAIDVVDTGSVVSSLHS